MTSFNPDEHPRDESGQFTAATPANLAVTGLGALAGGIAAKLGLRAGRKMDQGKLRQIATRVIDAHARAHATNEARYQRHRTTEIRVAGARGKRLVPTVLRMLGSQERRTGKELRDHVAGHSAEFLLEGETVRASDDWPGENALRDRIEQLRGRAADLALNARPAKRVPVAGHVRMPKVASFERTRRLQRAVQWSDQARSSFVDAMARGETADTLESIETGLKSGRPAVRRDAAEELERLGIEVPVVPQRGRRIQETVRNTPKIVAPSRRLVDEGYPTPKQRRGLARELADDIGNRSWRWTQRELEAARPRVQAAVAGAKAAIRPAAIPLLTRLKLLHPRGALAAGIIAAGAVTGAFATGLVHRRMSKRSPRNGEMYITPLAKAGPRQRKPADPAQAVTDAADGAEGKLAAGLADVFGQWATRAGDLVLGTRQGALMSTIHTDLDRALRPLAPVMQATAAASMLATDEDRTVTFTMRARNPRVEEFIRQYRENRVAELTKDQANTIKAVLVGAAQAGSAPQAIARQIQAVIGLTTNQARQVLSYRVGLQSLSPEVLERALRDKRFDGTVRKAIEAGKPLSEAQVDRIAGAYHRRYLAFRAMTIARTEAVGAANNGLIAGVMGLLEEHPDWTVVKTWMATDDERTRHDHRELNGQSVIGLQTAFTCADGSTIRWPHDPDGEAKQVINCRCTCSTRLVSRRLAAAQGTDSVAPLGVMEAA